LRPATALISVSESERAVVIVTHHCPPYLGQPRKHVNMNRGGPGKRERARIPRISRGDLLLDGKERTGAASSARIFLSLVPKPRPLLPSYRGRATWRAQSILMRSNGLLKQLSGLTFQSVSPGPSAGHRAGSTLMMQLIIAAAPSGIR